MTTLVAVAEIGALRSRLLIRHPDGPNVSLNLIWGDRERPLDRAEQLLVQNGYRRIGEWVDAYDGHQANVTADGETSCCSCWVRPYGNSWLIDRVGHGCPDHRDLWMGAS